MTTRRAFLASVAAALCRRARRSSKDPERALWVPGEEADLDSEDAAAFYNFSSRCPD